MSNILSVSLFGKFKAHYQDQVQKGLDAAKVQELLCYLIINRNRYHHREQLASILWTDKSIDQAKKYLRKALWQLQTAAFEPFPHSPDFLSVEIDWVYLNTRSKAIEMDINLFEKGISQFRGIQGEDLTQEQAYILEKALTLYQGDLLKGYYQDWVVLERERLQQVYLTGLDKLMKYCETNLEFEKGLAIGASILKYEHARESTHYKMIRLHYLAGDRTGALRQYERCKSVLEDDLGVEPAKQTNELLQQIQTDSLVSNLFAKTKPNEDHHIDSKLKDQTKVTVIDFQDRLLVLEKLINQVQDQIKIQKQIINSLNHYERQL